MVCFDLLFKASNWVRALECEHVVVLAGKLGAAIKSLEQCLRLGLPGIGVPVTFVHNSLVREFLGRGANSRPFGRSLAD